jgi:hypothetical protein
MTQRSPVAIVMVSTALALALLSPFTGPAAAAGNNHDLLVELFDTIDGEQVLAGDRWRLEAMVTNMGDGRVGPIVISLDIVGGTLDEPVTPRVRWREDDGRWHGRLRRLNAGQSVLVELFVSFDPTTAATQQFTVGGGLVVSAEVRNDDETTVPVVTDSWMLENCSALYHYDLQAIALSEMNALREAAASAQEGWRALSGGWVVRPPRIRDDDEFKAVIDYAARLVRRRGVERTLARTMKEESEARLMTDLGVYVEQRQTLAICTGTVDYMDFFDREIGELRGRSDRTVERFEDAGQQADWKLGRTESLLAATLNVAEGEDVDGLRATKSQLRRLTERARDLWLEILIDDARTGHLRSNVEAVSTIASALEDISVRQGSPLRDTTDALRLGLSALEAFAYVQNTQAHYVSVTGGYDRVVQQVLDAHQRTCVCGN